MAANRERAVCERADFSALIRPLHQPERGQKHGKPGQAWPGQACQGLGRACQGLEVSLAIEAWFFRSH